MPAQQLREYQQRGLHEICEAWKRGARSVLSVLPTGGGKTSVFCSLVAQVVPRGARAVILVHRRELATQACTRLREFDVDYGLILAGEPSKPYAPVQVASVQTLIRREPPEAGLVICDEAHLSTAKTWATILAAYPKAKILGVTATPWRLSGTPLASAYDESVVISTPRELREQGFLSPYVGFSYQAPDLKGVKRTGGDYNERQTAAKMSTVQIVGDIVEQWGQHARDLSTVVFAVTVEHSKQLATAFRTAGASAEHLDGSTPLEQRKAILKRVASGETRVLCNVGVAVEGLDIPRLKCCVLARPTMSTSRALQMSGRVRRPWEGVTARIHDHGWVIKQHGLPDMDRDYSLDAAKEESVKEEIGSLTTCPSCMALYSGAECPNCAEPRPVGERVIVEVQADQTQFASGGEEAKPRSSSRVMVRWSRDGKIIEGSYQGAEEEQTDFGTRRRYLVDGERWNYSLPGTSRLDVLMSHVKPGQLIRVTYNGETQLGGARVRKEFTLEADDGEPEPAPARKPYPKQKPPAWLIGALNGIQKGKRQAAAYPRTTALLEDEVREWRAKHARGTPIMEIVKASGRDYSTVRSRLAQ